MIVTTYSSLKEFYKNRPLKKILNLNKIRLFIIIVYVYFLNEP